MLLICMTISGTVPFDSLYPDLDNKTGKIFIPARPETGIAKPGRLSDTFSAS